MNGVYWSQNLALQWCEFCPVGSRLDWRALREKKKKKRGQPHKSPVSPDVSITQVWPFIDIQLSTFTSCIDKVY